MDLQPGMDWRVPGFLEDPRVRALLLCAVLRCAVLWMLSILPLQARGWAQGAAAGERQGRHRR